MFPIWKHFLYLCYQSSLITKPDGTGIQMPTEYEKTHL